MKQKSLSVVFVFILGMVMVVGTVRVLAAGSANSQTAATGISVAEQHEAVTRCRPELQAGKLQPQKSMAFPDQRDAVHDAVLWLIGNHQNDDGGYTSFSAGANQAPSSVAGTMDAILAISAAGYNPAANFPGKTHNPVRLPAE